MAHLPPKLSGIPDPFAQAKTLFLPMPGTAGIVVTVKKGKRTSRAKKFAGPEAALAWCLAQQAGMVLIQTPDPSLN